MKKDTVHAIFPIGVYSSNLNRNFTDKENAFFESCYKKTTNNIGNKITGEEDILNFEEMKDIKYFIQEKLNDCFYNTYKCFKKSEIYITQSWLNYTEKNEYHHLHVHSNSFFSGVFYINVDSEKDKIVFQRDALINSVLSIEKEELNMFQSFQWWLPCENGTLYIFPSKLQHMVPTKEHDGVRISLSFNTFIRGFTGHSESKGNIFLP